MLEGKDYVTDCGLENVALTAVAQNGEVSTQLHERCNGRAIVQVINSSGVVVEASASTHSITFNGNSITYKNLAASAFTGTMRVMSIL